MIRFAILTAALFVAAPASAAIPPKVVKPSFDCAKARAQSIDAVICADRELSILDRTMGLDYKRALLETPRSVMPAFLREQRSFIANRDLCMKRKADWQACIAFAYESRIMRLEEWIDHSAWQLSE